MYSAYMKIYIVFSGVITFIVSVSVGNSFLSLCTLLSLSLAFEPSAICHDVLQKRNMSFF